MLPIYYDTHTNTSDSCSTWSDLIVTELGEGEGGRNVLCINT